VSGDRRALDADGSCVSLVHDEMCCTRGFIEIDFRCACEASE